MKTKLGGRGRGGWSTTWEFFQHNPVFFSDNDPYLVLHMNSVGARFTKMIDKKIMGTSKNPDEENVRDC